MNYNSSISTPRLLSEWDFYSHFTSYIWPWIKQLPLWTDLHRNTLQCGEKGAIRIHDGASPLDALLPCETPASDWNGGAWPCSCACVFLLSLGFSLQVQSGPPIPPSLFLLQPFSLSSCSAAQVSCGSWSEGGNLWSSRLTTSSDTVWLVVNACNGSHCAVVWNRWRSPRCRWIWLRVGAVWHKRDFQLAEPGTDGAGKWGTSQKHWNPHPMTLPTLLCFSPPVLVFLHNRSRFPCQDLRALVTAHKVPA